MRLATRVQHHPARAHLLPELLARLDGLDPQVVVDPGAEEPHWSAWRSYEACLRTLPAQATHLLIIQDDVRPCDGFAAGVHAALAAQPEAIICFFLGGRPATSARALVAAAGRCESWVELDRSQWVPVVATAYPRADALALLSWSETDYTGPRRGDDNVVGAFVKRTGRRALATVPSLVQHEDLVPSLAGRVASKGRDRGRVAACYIGEHSPELIDFTSG